MHYYVMKTGLPMFDACRAYGLALVVERLAKATDALEDVTIQDLGTLYLVQGPEIQRLTVEPTIGVFDELLVPSDGWCGVLVTTGRTPREENLKPRSRKRVESRIKDVGEVIHDYQSLLRVFTEPAPMELRSQSGDEWESIPAALDVAASKGIRRAKLDGYTEGRQLLAPTAHWAVGVLGGAHFVRSAWAGGDYARLLATPEFITLTSHHYIRSILNAVSLCGVSTDTVAAHYAVQLAHAIQKRRADRSIYADRYDSLIVQTLTYSGNQWKAQTGTTFPLQYMMQLIASDISVASELLSVWNRLFRWGSVKGYEALALTLAEFLGQPSLESFERHARVHLKMGMEKQKRQSFPRYQEEWMREVLRHV